MNYVCSAVDTIIKHEPLSEGQRMRITRRYTSRVHVTDICQALKASIQNASFGYVQIVLIVKLGFLPSYLYAGSVDEISHWETVYKIKSKKIEKCGKGCLC